MLPRARVAPPWSTVCSDPGLGSYAVYPRTLWSGDLPAKAHTVCMTPSPAQRRHLSTSPFQPVAEREIEHFECGDRVCHDAYGMGHVVSTEAQAVTVDFHTSTVRVCSPFNKMTKL